MKKLIKQLVTKQIKKLVKQPVKHTITQRSKKKTTRIATIAVPNGTVKQMVRYFVRDVTTATEYPVDKEIDVASYVHHDLNFTVDDHSSVQGLTEDVLLAQAYQHFPVEGILIMGVRDVVTLEDEDIEVMDEETVEIDAEEEVVEWVEIDVPDPAPAPPPAPDPKRLIPLAKTDEVK
jgi:hypothetical protein